MNTNTVSGFDKPELEIIMELDLYQKYNTLKIKNEPNYKSKHVI